MYVIFQPQNCTHVRTYTCMCQVVQLTVVQLPKIGSLTYKVMCSYIQLYSIYISKIVLYIRTYVKTHSRKAHTYIIGLKRIVIFCIRIFCNAVDQIFEYSLLHFQIIMMCTTCTCYTLQHMHYVRSKIFLHVAKQCIRFETNIRISKIAFEYLQIRIFVEYSFEP